MADEEKIAQEEEQDTPQPVVADIAEPNNAQSGEKTSLHRVYGSNLSTCMVVAILFNFAMLLYSQIGSSAQIKFSLDDDEQIILDIEGGCANINDEAIINSNASLRDEMNVVGFQLGIDCTLASEFDALECFLDRLPVESGGLSSDCVSCIAQFTQCLQNNCLGAGCRLQAFNQADCEVCSNQHCEFQFETCAGFQFYPNENTVDTCLTGNDGRIQNTNDEVFINLPLILARLENECDSNDAVCVRQQFVDEFAPTQQVGAETITLFFSDDCLTCLDDHAECIVANCLTECTGNSTIGDCEQCVEGSVCAQQYNTCSGINRYTIARALSETTDMTWTPKSQRHLQQVIEFDDDQCLNKDGVPLFDRVALTFIDSIARALDGGSIGLALLLGIFSGVWPHTKNLIMLYVWFVPMSNRGRTKLLRIFSVLLSWSLVDVFAVVLLANGSLIQKQLASGIAFLLFLEPRPGVYFFGISALWAIAQAMVIRHFSDKLLAAVPKDAVAPTVNDYNSFKKKKALLGFLSIISLMATLLAAYLPNLEMELVGAISNPDTNGLNNYEYNIFELGAELFSSCSLFEEHGSVAGAYFLGFLFIFLVVIVPAVATLSLFLVSMTLNIGGMSVKAKKNVKRAFIVGNFAALDVWLVTLLVFSNQFAGLIRGAVGDENNCGLSDAEVEAGEICVGLEGKLGLGAFVMMVAVVTFWVAQCLTTSLVATARKFDL